MFQLSPTENDTSGHSLLFYPMGSLPGLVSIYLFYTICHLQIFFLRVHTSLSHLLRESCKEIFVQHVLRRILLGYFVCFSRCYCSCLCPDEGGPEFPGQSLVVLVDSFT